MYRVILVDDEVTILTGLSRLLPWAEYGCEVVATAENGEAALKLVEQHRPHILFTDIRMPGMDGLALIAALRSEYPDIQITILSGYPEFEYAQRAIRLGVASYVLKPSKMEELREALGRMVARLKNSGALPESPAAAGDESAQAHIMPEATADAPEPPLPTADEGQEAAGNFIIKNALKYIEEHYDEKLTLPDVAEQVYVSQWHLSKLIARHTGQSFSDLLNGVRITKAKQLLADPSLKIWEISEQVGFSDVTHFSRIFKKLENRSANEYRNQMAPNTPDLR